MSKKDEILKKRALAGFAQFGIKAVSVGKKIYKTNPTKRKNEKSNPGR